MKTPIPLTPTEQRYLDYMEASPEGVNLDRLHMGSISPFRIGNLVAVNVKNLRRKLPPGYAIETVRGWGYRLVKV